MKKKEMLVLISELREEMRLKEIERKSKEANHLREYFESTKEQLEKLGAKNVQISVEAHSVGGCHGNFFKTYRIDFNY